MSQSSHYSGGALKADELDYNDVSPTKQAFKGHKMSDDHILENESNDTKYFNKSNKR